MTRKIGDIVPLEHDINPEEIRLINARRKASAKLISGETKPTNSLSRQAAAAIKNSMANEERMRDPFEQVKTFLRSKGYIPVASLPGQGHQVGRRRFETEAEVFEFAASRGWGR